MPEQHTQTDHDLIVSMHTTMARAVADIKSLDDKLTEMNNNYVKKVDHDRDMDDIKTDVKWLQRIAYISIGLLGALEFYFNYIHK